MMKQAIAVAILAAFAGVSAAQAPDAKAPAKGAPAKAAPAAAPAGSSKELYPKIYFDFLLKERLAQGQPDTPELRNSLREELNTRELLLREAKKKGLDKSNEVKNQMELAAQTVLVRAYVADWVKENPVADAMLRKEYDTIKAQIGDREYKVRHILVEKEDEAKDIIASLQKGEKFEKLAERSKDPGSKEKGGDLDWASPANYVKPFSDAMMALQKGKFTPTPVQTQFGWHVIMLEDVRDTKAPSYEEVKPNLTQRAQGLVVEKHIAELRTKAAIK